MKQLPAELSRWSLARFARFHLEHENLDYIESIAVSGEPPTRPQLALFELQSFVELPPEEVLERTTGFLGTMASSDAALVYRIRSRAHQGDGGGSDYRFFYGVAWDKPSQPRTLQSAIQAYFRGSELRNVPATEVERSFSEEIRAHGACAVLTGIPSERVATPVETRLDEALEGLSGYDFDLLVVAHPADAEPHLRGLNQLYDSLAPIARGTQSVGSSEGFSRSVQRGLSASISEGTSLSESSSETIGETRTEGRQWNEKEGKRAALAAAGTPVGAVAGAAVGVVIGGAVGTVLGPPGVFAGAFAVGKAGAVIGAGLGAAVGGSLVKPESRSESDATSKSVTKGVTQGRSWSETHGWSESETEGISETISRQLSVERVSREAVGLLDTLDQHLDRRLRTARGLGLWEVSVHVCAANQAELRLICSVLQGALRGDDTWMEPLRTTVYEPAALALRHLAHLASPRLNLPPNALVAGVEQPVSYLSSIELGYYLRPPTNDLPGFPIRPAIDFGRQVAKAREGGTLRVGDLVHRGRRLENASVHLAARDLTSHALVVGTTGSGKTTTLQSLLWQLATELEVPFLVVEPAKSGFDELKDALTAVGTPPATLVAGRPGDAGGFQLNPLQVPEGYVIARHIDGLRTILRSAFSMDASLPQILERAVIGVYEDRFGKDLGIAWNVDLGSCPTLADLLAPSTESGHRSLSRKRNLSPLKRAVQKLGYSRRVYADLQAAITVRMQSLTLGLKSVVFAQDSPSIDELLSEGRTFLDLRLIDDPDARRLVMASLVRRIYAYRERQGTTSDLRHMLVLEEAHHLLRRAQGAGPGADLVRQSNQAIADLMAEIRAYGQGILVVDQSPTDLDPAVLRNTNTKIVHRMFFNEDCQAVGDAMGVDEESQLQFRRLRPGECVLSTPGLSRPVQIAVKAEPWEQNCD